MFLKATCWEEVKKRVKKANKPFYKLVETGINPTAKYPLYLARYSYGELITLKGSIQLSSDGTDATLKSKRIAKELSYATTPLMMQLGKQAEAFIDSTERTIPLNIFSPGDFYGLFEAVEPFTGSKISPAWSVSSGVRSSFMLPRISDRVFHRRLQKYYHFSNPVPQTLYDQWEIFKQVAKQNDTAEPWSSEVLIFPKQWFAKHQGDPGWLEFQNYLLSACWRQAELFRKKYELSACWETFGAVIRSLKPNIYLVDTVKHLMQAAESTVPVFKPDLQNNEALPSCLIESAYSEVYRLKDYAPCIMIPEKLTQKQPIYYSMAYPTILEGTPNMRRMRSFLAEVKGIRKLLMKFIEILNNEHDVDFKFLEKNFNFYHTGSDNDSEIQHAKTLDCSIHLSHLIEEYYRGLSFPNNSHFFRGCIEIQHFIQNE